jgi:hypothetical protein
MPAADIGTFRIVDEAEQSTVLDDLDDGTRTQVRELELNVPIREIDEFTPANAPGGDTTHLRDPLVLTRWKQGLHYSDQTYDQLAARARNIVKLLRRGGMIEFTPRDSATALLIDYEPGSGFALFGESPEDTFRALTSRAYPAGIPITIRRQPGLRESARDPAVNKLSNGTMLMDSNRDGTPNGWTFVAGTHTIQSTEWFRISHNAAADLTQRDYTAAAGTQVAVSIEARKVSGDRTVEIRLLSMPSATVLATATVTATAEGTRYSVVGTVAGADTSVRISIRYTGGTNATVSEFRHSQLETGTLVASSFRVGPEPVSNDPASATGARSIAIYNAGDIDAPFDLTIQAEAADTPRIEQIRTSLRAGDGVAGHRALTGYLNETRFAQCDASGNGWTRTLTNDTASVADSDASGGNAAECSYTTDPTVMAKRVRLTRTTLLDSLRGYSDPILRLKPSAASKHEVQLRWSPSLADPAIESAPAFELDWSDAASFAYEEWILGTTYLSEDLNHDLGGLALEIWSRRISGTGTLRFDCIPNIIPVDPLAGERVALLSVPGSSKEFWRGKELVAPTNPAGLTAGTVKGNRIRLNAANEAAGTPPVGGLGWPAGRHRVTFHINGNGKMDFTGRVRNITDSATTRFRDFVDRRPAGVREFTIQFDSVAGKAYQPQILLTGGVSATDFLDVLRIGHRFTPYLGASEQMRTDVENALLEKLDSSGNVVARLGLEGPLPVMAPPGISILNLDAYDIPIDSGSTGPESKITRDLTLSAAHSPRREL